MIKQRVPDSEHLTRMRALLVAAHQNDAFVKNVASGNSYVPQNLDPNGSKEMGASFDQVMQKRNARMQRQLDKADAEENENDKEDNIEALIRGDNLNQQTQMIDTESDESVVHDSEQEDDANIQKANAQLDIPDLTSTGQIAAAENATHTSISSGMPKDYIGQAISSVDFKRGLDNASAAMIRDYIQRTEDKGLMKELAIGMHDNEFFKMFASKYQKGLNRALAASKDQIDSEQSSIAPKKAQPAGSKSVPANAKKSVKKANFSKQIMDHVSNTNYFRKNLPHIFTGESAGDSSSILQEKLKNFSPVPLPIELKKAQDHQVIIEKHRQLSPLKNSYSTRTIDIGSVDEHTMRGARGSISGRRQSVPTKQRKSPNHYEDENFLRRLKQKNYGKWYLDPKDFTRKI